MRVLLAVLIVAVLGGCQGQPSLEIEKLTQENMRLQSELWDARREIKYLEDLDRAAGIAAACDRIPIVGWLCSETWLDSGRDALARGATPNPTWYWTILGFAICTLLLAAIPPLYLCAVLWVTLITPRLELASELEQELASIPDPAMKEARLRTVNAAIAARRARLKALRKVDRARRAQITSLNDQIAQLIRQAEMRRNLR